jgi:methyltransferase (TIGR00027 family)
MQPQIEHVSDTALLIAAARAIETERPDGLIRDPFAAQLAGDRGLGLARTGKAPEWMAFGIGIRTHSIDELVLKVIGKGDINTVLSLGAGLDTRAWRLDLPASLRWIEVDFPAILDYKSRLLADVPAHCHVERDSADLNDTVGRRRVLDRASADDSRCLIISEGLLEYLPIETLRAFIQETLATPAFRFWMFDVTSPYLMRLAHAGLVDDIENVRAETHLKADELVELVKKSGWHLVESRKTVEESMRIGRHRVAPLIEALMKRNEAPPKDDVSGVWLWRSETH